MIEDFNDLELDNVDTIEQVEERLKEKLGITFDQLRNSLSEYVLAHAEELTHEFVNMAPYGDFAKLMEDNDSMAAFLKSEAHKPENWILQGLTPSDVQKTLISFHFANKSVDDGDVFDGFVYVSFSGKIKHAFAQGNDN